MDAEEHDAVLAAVSHLPHLLAFALVHEVAGRRNSKELFSFAAGGFRDFTRIASSHPEMWRDICVANRDRLLEEVSRFSKKLEQVKALLDHPEKLETLFAEARAARDAWIHSS
jgi:prephenate dehydrogenase